MSGPNDSGLGIQPDMLVEIRASLKTLEAVPAALQRLEEKLEKQQEATRDREREIETRVLSLEKSFEAKMEAVSREIQHVRDSQEREVSELRAIATKNEEEAKRRQADQRRIWITVATAMIIWTIQAILTSGILTGS